MRTSHSDHSHMWGGLTQPQPQPQMQSSYGNDQSGKCTIVHPVRLYLLYYFSALGAIRKTCINRIFWRKWLNPFSHPDKNIHTIVGNCNDRLLKAFAATVNCKLSSELLPPRRALPPARRTHTLLWVLPRTSARQRRNTSSTSPIWRQWIFRDLH